MKNLFLMFLILQLSIFAKPSYIKEKSLLILLRTKNSKTIDKLNSKNLKLLPLWIVQDIKEIQKEKDKIKKNILIKDTIQKIKVSNQIKNVKNNPNYINFIKSFKKTQKKKTFFLYKLIDKLLSYIIKYFPNKSIFKIIFLFIMFLGAIFVIYYTLPNLLKKSTSNKKGNRRNIIEKNYIQIAIEAEGQGQYRTALHFLYLFFLYSLNKYNIIEYTASSTERELIKNIKSNKIGTLFKKNALNFEALWFNNKRISKDSYYTFKQDISKALEIINIKI